MRKRRCVMVNLVDWRMLGTGSAQHQLGLLRAWRRLGYEVRMIAPRPTEPASLPPDLSQAMELVASVRRLGLPGSLDTLMQLLKLIQLRLAWRPDIVFSRVNSLTVFIVALCRLLRVRIIIDHNGWLAKERQQAGGNRLLARLEEISQITAARWADGSRCVTRGMAVELSRYGVEASRLHIVGNGTDTAEFHRVDRAKALAAFGLPIDRDYVGFLGNIVPWHRVDIAIAALAAVASQYPRLDLLIFGDGPSLAELRRQAAEAGIANRVVFMGRIGSDHANLAINCFSLGVVPLTLKRDTAFGYSPVKIRDYAAAGCPILTGHVPDNIELDGMGWLFTHAADDATAMAGKLAELFADPGRLERARELAREYAVANFDWDAIGRQIMQKLDPGGPGRAIKVEVDFGGPPGPPTTASV